MKILLIVDDYLPVSTKVAAKMMHELAIEFQNNGHQVTVLTPNFQIKKKFSVEIVDSINVVFFKTGKIKNISKIRRAINESLLSYFAWKATKEYLSRNPHDAIVFYSPSIFWGGFVKRLKKMWRVKSYLILRDIFPQWAVDNGLLKNNSPIHKYFKYFEKEMYEIADKIGVMSPSNLNLFKSIGEDISKFEVLYNWSKISEIVPTSTTIRKELNLENKVVFFYGGNIGLAQNMMNLIRLADKMQRHSNVHFLFVGAGDEVELILKETKKNKIKNVTYLPPVDQNTYEAILNEFDIGLFSLHPDHKTHNFPGKLLSYMLFEKPILGSVNNGNDLKKIVNEAEAGFVFDNGEDDKLYEAALKLANSKEIRDKMGKNGNLLLNKTFSVKNAVQTILQNFQK